MITSLNRIGKQLRENKDPLDSIISIPKLSERDKEKNNYVLKIIFDVDNKNIIISKSNLVEYSPNNSPKEFYHIKTLQGRYRKIYITTEFRKIDSFRISFFGNTDASQGDFASYIEDEFPKLKGSPFYTVLNSIFTLKDFESKIEKQNIKEILELSSNENLVFVTSLIINSNLGLKNPTYLFDLEGYKEFLSQRFLEPSESAGGFCYVNGCYSDAVNPANFNARFSINKIFVTTTKNYLSFFDDSRSFQNYQISEAARFNLEESSNFITSNLRTSIAGISNLVFPTFLSTSNIDIIDVLPRINKINDLAFKYRDFQNVVNEIEEQISDDLYWLNFVSYESDGNYFKIVAFIKDIPQFYFIRLLEKLVKTSLEFEDFYIPKSTFNLHSIYNLIPVRCNSKGEVLSKHNEALLIIKDIIEKRKISFDRLTNSFVELVLIHRLKRFRQYKQFNKRRDSNFDYEIFNAVFNYSILFKTLIDLDLLEDHKFLGDTMNDNGNQIDNYINDFFSKMNYSQPQKAMFFLGRMLDNVAYEQYKKGHKTKPVLGKINFNGLDCDDIQRLYEDLFEKARQYNIVNKVEYNSSYFMQYFNPNDWNNNGLNKKEALFFLLAGYSFGIALSKDRKQSLIENEENNDE